VLRVGREFVTGLLVGRPNRFTLLVEVGGREERAYLANPGRLSTVIEKGREVLLVERRVAGRRTAYDAFAVRVGGFYVTLRSLLANDLLEAALREGLVEEFRGFSIERERALPGYGRVDFLLRRGGEVALIEVKSTTHVEGGTAKFPDRPTERGRRQVGRLIELARRGESCFLFFVVQRPDADRFAPFHEVDPEFSRLVEEAAGSGVRLRALSTEFSLRGGVVRVLGFIPVVLGGRELARG